MALLLPCVYCAENALATVDSDAEIPCDNHYDQSHQTLNHDRKTVKETPIWV